VRKLAGVEMMMTMRMVEAVVAEGLGEAAAVGITMMMIAIQ
jgi:hypothetical protein